MRKSIVTIGLGQLGTLFSQGFLQSGFTVVPILRGTQPMVTTADAPELVLIAVGEDSVSPVLDEVPNELLGKVVLLQNELYPGLWLDRYRARGDLPGPNICIVWFEKKGDRPPVVVLPSVLYGPESEKLAQALSKLNLPSRQVTEAVELHHELALKNLYILALNIGGLAGATQASDILDAAYESLVDELIELEQAGLVAARIGTHLEVSRLKADLKGAIEADPNHACAGRSAPMRLARTILRGDAWGVELPRCRAIANSTTT